MLFDVETAPFDNRCLGVEHAWGYFWVTGAGHTSGTGWNYQVHQYELNTAGVTPVLQYIQSHPQVSAASSWGGRDMETNEAETNPVQDLMWIGSNSGELAEYEFIDPTPGFSGDELLVHLGTYIINDALGFPISTVRAVARVPYGKFYTKSFSSDIYEFSIFPQGGYGPRFATGQWADTGTSVYGFGWSSAHSKIWTCSGIGTVESETYEVSTLPTATFQFGTATTDSPGGADVYWDAFLGKECVVLLHQTTPDSIGIYETAPMKPTLDVTQNVIAQQATIDVKRGTPFGKVFLGYSMISEGPLATAFGDIFLDPADATQLPPATLDVNGDWSRTLSTAGVPTGTLLWVHGLDQVSGTFLENEFIILL